MDRLRVSTRFDDTLRKVKTMGMHAAKSLETLLDDLLERWRSDAASPNSTVRNALGSWLSKELVEGEAYEETPIRIKDGWTQDILPTGSTHEAQGYETVEDFLDSGITGETMEERGDMFMKSVDDRFMETCRVEEGRWLSEQPVFGTFDGTTGIMLIGAFADAILSKDLGHQHWRSELGKLSIAELRSEWPIEPTSPKSI
jgi:hypothetical protein